MSSKYFFYLQFYYQYKKRWGGGAKNATVTEHCILPVEREPPTSTNINTYSAADCNRCDGNFEIGYMEKVYILTFQSEYIIDQIINEGKLSGNYLNRILSVV